MSIFKSFHQCRYAIACLFAMIVVGSVQSAEAARRVHLLVVGDTQDPTIGKHAAFDVTAVMDLFTANVNSQQLSKREVSTDTPPTRETMLQSIRDLNIQPDDAIVFYYSGHGLYTKDGLHYLATAGGQDLTQRGDLLQAMQASGASLSVLITDACFNFKEIPPRAIRQAVPGVNVTSPLFQSLFFDVDGVVDVNSARQGQVAGTYPDNAQGSIFTKSWVTVLKENRQLSLTWAATLDQTAVKTRSEFQKVYIEGEQVETETGIVLQRTQEIVRLKLEIQRRQQTNPAGQISKSTEAEIDPRTGSVTIYQVERQVDPATGQSKIVRRTPSGSGRAEVVVADDGTAYYRYNGTIIQAAKSNPGTTPPAPTPVPIRITRLLNSRWTSEYTTEQGAAITAPLRIQTSATGRVAQGSYFPLNDSGALTQVQVATRPASDGSNETIYFLIGQWEFSGLTGWFQWELYESNGRQHFNGNWGFLENGKRGPSRGTWKGSLQELLEPMNG